MARSRETIMEALQTRLATAYSFGAVGRRNRAPDSIAAPGQPALLLVKHREIYVRMAPTQPPKRTMVVMAIVYIDAGNDENVIPDAIINPIQDAIDAALAPDNAMTGLCTLGGVCYSAMISGEVTSAPGDLTGKGLAVIPIEIIIP